MALWSRTRESERTRAACDSTELGNALLDQGDPTAAAIAYRQAIRTAPAPLLEALYLVAGLLESGVGDARRARRMLRRAATAKDEDVSRRARHALRDWVIDPDVMQSPRSTLVTAADLERLRELARSARPTSPPQPRGRSAPPPRRMRPLPGGVYRYSSFLVALLAIVLVQTLLLGPDGAASRWQRSWPVLAAAAVTAAGAVLYLHRRARAVRRLHLERPAPPPAEGELFVLYLRSFRDDEERGAQGRITTFPFAVGPDEHLVIDLLSAHGAEEQLLAHLRPLGRPIAIGTPGQVGPPAGPERLFVVTEQWQDRVRELLRRARLVVLVLGPTPGTLWEFVEATRVVAPPRLVLVVGDRSEYRTFRELAAAALRKRADEILAATGERWSPPSLPDHVAPDPPLDPPHFSGLITYSALWQPEFLPLDAAPPVDTLSARVRRRVEPIVRDLIAYESSRPGGNAGETVVLTQPSYRSMPFAERLPYLVGGALVMLFLALTGHIWAQSTVDWLLPVVVGGVVYARLTVEERRLRRQYGDPAGPRPARLVRPNDTDRR